METGPETRSYVANPADLPRGTLVQLFFDAVERFDAPDALRGRDAQGRWRSLSHREVLEAVRGAALALESLGLRRGDHLAILSENRPEWALADFATLCFGGVDVPVYATLPANQVVYILRDSGARLAFVSTADQLAKVREIWAELPALERVVVFDELAEPGERVLTFRHLLELGRAQETAGKGAGFRERALAAGPDDLATLIYTSGTTGEPKGVMLTHNNLYSNTRAVEAILPVARGDVALSFLPVSHVFERMVDYFLFGRGVVLAYLSSFDLIAQGLLEVKPVIIASAPRVYEKVYTKVMSGTGVKRRIVRWAKRVGDAWAEARVAGRSPGPLVSLQHGLADRLVFSKVRERVGGRLRYLISGSAPLNGDVARFFYAAGLPILEGYGLTETSPVTNVNSPTAFRFGTVGKPVPGTEERIAEDGEILVRGPQVMKGYYGKPEETRQVLDEDGWFRTGDIGAIDADGFLRITDRKKDLLKTAGGKYIAPAPIENRVKANPFVAEAVVIGDRRPFAVLLVVPNFEALAPWAESLGVTGGRAELLKDERVRSKLESEIFGQLTDLARFEQPKKVALLPDEFSIDGGQLTPSLKVKRRVIEEHYRNEIEALYAGAEQVAQER